MCTRTLMLIIVAGWATGAAGQTAAVPAAAPASSEVRGLLSEPAALANIIDFVDEISDDFVAGQRARSGWYPEFSNLPTGAGWISGGPGYRHWMFDDRALVETSAAISWHKFKMAQARFEVPDLTASHVTVGSQVLWQDLTALSYFGVGPDTSGANRSEYRLKSSNVVAYATSSPAEVLTIGGRIGWLHRPSILAPSASLSRKDYPDAAATFADDVVYAIPQQPNFVHGEAFAMIDTRDHRGHPTSGGIYRTGWSMYSDRNDATFTFQRYEAEAAQFIPLAASRVVFAFHGWFVASGTAADQVVPFYLMPSLGGANTLRAYTSYRFHDRNLAVVNAETRVALFTHLDAAAFVDAGNVAPRVSGLDLARRSYGAGLRVHTGRGTTLARLDVARGGDEGWSLAARLNDPLRLGRLGSRLAAIPFVP